MSYLHYNAIMQTPVFTRFYAGDSAIFESAIQNQVRNALAEDIGSGDLTAYLIAADKLAEATIISRQDAVICGIDWVNTCFDALDQNVKIDWRVNEGESIRANQQLCTIKGNARTLLTAERTALNFLQLLSAVATQTQAYVKAIAGTQAKILDTRKTIPGLRLAQKYAVTVGGGVNQRMALYDGILIKENHIAAAGSIQAALAQAQARVQAQAQHKQRVSIQIEVETIAQLKAAIAAGASSILLDNFGLTKMREAVSINARTVNSQRALLEASGNVSLETVRLIAETGVDRISIGALTKSIQAIDLSMRIQ